MEKVWCLDGSAGRRQNVDDGLLSEMVSARLDLPVIQRLLDRGFKLSVIKRCWEDQLRLNGEWMQSVGVMMRVSDVFVGDDFVEDTDLWLACTILQKQIDRIDGKKENIVIPRVVLGRTESMEQNGW